MLETLIQDLRSTTKTGAKLDILEKLDSDFLRYILIATFDPFLLFHVKLKLDSVPTEGTRSINSLDVQEEFKNLLEMCKKNNSNKQNRINVIAFLSTLNKGSQELIYSVINKDWKAGVSNKTIKKLYNNLIPSFEVQLSNKYHEVIAKKSYKPKDRYCSV